MWDWFYPILFCILFLYGIYWTWNRKQKQKQQTKQSYSVPMFSIDIETGGPQPRIHPLLAVGVCFRDKYGKKEKKRFVFQFDRKNFEPETLEWWESKNATVLKILEESDKTTIHEFANYLDSMDEKYPNMMLISDNPGFDAAFIDHHFSVTLKRRPTNYRLGKRDEYRQYVCQNSFMYAGLLAKGIKTSNWVSDKTVVDSFKLKLNSIHDHIPENDAEHILDLLVAVMASLPIGLLQC